MLFRNRPDEQNKVAAYLRRICDLTSPNLPRFDDSRVDSRQNRTIPVLLTPWEDDRPIIEETTTALTKDISDRGLSVTLPGPFRAREVVVGIWLTNAPETEGPRFFLGEARQNVAIGGGFWALGIEATQLIYNVDIEELVPIAKSRLQLPSYDALLPSALLGS